jgi:hypothetical protein
MEVTFIGCLTGASVLFVVVIIGANLKLIFSVIYVTTLYLGCADIMISERKVIQSVAGGGRVLMWDRSVMVDLTLATCAKP